MQEESGDQTTYILLSDQPALPSEKQPTHKQFIMLKQISLSILQHHMPANMVVVVVEIYSY